MIAFKDGYHVVDSTLIRNLHKTSSTPESFVFTKSQATKEEFFDALLLDDPFDVTFELLWENRLKN